MKKRLNRIKPVLAEFGITNRKLATKLSVSELTVSRWVTNRQQPSIGTLFKIAKVLNVDVCDLLVRDALEDEDVSKGRE